jgi:predicted permease
MSRRTRSARGSRIDISRAVDDELRSHLEARAADLEAAGRTRHDAWAQAAREFGDVDEARRYITAIDLRTAASAQRRSRMEGIGQDLRLAVRHLRRAPAFTTAVVLTFAIGIGANAAIFSVVNGVLLQPLPFPDPGRLYAVYSANRSAGMTHASVSAVDLDDWRAARRRVEDIGGYLYADGDTGVDLIGRGTPRRLSAVFITAGFLSALGMTPEAGRLPRDEELTRGGPDRVVLLTDGFWGREFGRDRAIVGSTLTLNNEPFAVIGVLPATLQFPTEGADVYVPFSTIPDSGIPRIRPVRLLGVVARVRPGGTQEEVQAEMSAITSRLATQYPDDQAWGGATVVPLAETIIGPVRDGLLVLFGAVAFVLAMACVNVASLQLARASSQARDLAISAALGASRARLVRQILTEGLVLSVTGGLMGVALAAGGVAVFLRLAAGQLPRATGVHVDGLVVGFALVASVVAGVMASLVPALRATDLTATRDLRDAGRGIAGAESPRLRAALVVVQVAVAMMLAVGAGLMSRSLFALLHVDPGFQADHLIAAQFTIDQTRHAPLTRYYSEVIDRVRALPGVVSAAAVKDAPFRGNGERIGFTIPTQPMPPGQDPPTARVIHVSDGYFRTIGARLADGREFTPFDREGAPLVLVVNEAFARQFFPGQRAVGQHLLVGRDQTITIVGVVRDIRQRSLADPVPPTTYLDNLQNSRVKTTIVARTQGDPALMATALRDAIWSVDSAQPIADVFTFDEAVSRSLATPRLTTVLLVAFGTLGFALGVVGIYGLLASLVSRRRKEIGIRMALGGSSSTVAAMIVRRGAGLGLVGVTLGMAGAAGLTRFISTLLYGVTPLDPSTFVVTATGLLAAAVLASWLPARRAARVDPANVLRSP